MTEHGEPNDLQTSTSPDADRRRAFAALLLAMPDVSDDADFERLPSLTPGGYLPSDI